METVNNCKNKQNAPCVFGKDKKRMRIFLLPLLFVPMFFQLCIGAYDPNKFVIGAFSGPVLTGNPQGITGDIQQYQNIQNDNFNLIYCDCNNNPAQDIVQNNFWTFGNPNSPMSNSYRLNCLSQMSNPILQTLVCDAAIGYSGNQNLFPFITGVASAVNNYIGLSKRMQDRMIGFNLADEPQADDYVPSKPTDVFVLTKNLLSQMKIVSDAKHPEMLSFVNLLPFQYGEAESHYDSYVGAYANRSGKLLYV